MLLGGVDLSMSAAVQPVATLPTLPSSGPPPPHNPLHHTAGGLALPALGSAPVMMPRPPTTAMPPLGPSLPPSHQDAADLAEAAPNQDVLLALLARNKNLEGKDSFLSPPPPSSPDRALRLLLSSRGMPIDPRSSYRSGRWSRNSLLSISDACRRYANVTRSFEIVGRNLPTIVDSPTPARDSNNDSKETVRLRNEL